MNDPTSPFAPKPTVHTTREDILDTQIASYLTRGWRIESKTTHSAVMVKGKRVNHLLHLVLTLCTLGLWAIVWLIVSIAGGEKREHLAS